MILTGLARLGRDVQLRYIPQGEAVCNLALAFPYGKKDSSGNRPTQWVEASLWGKQAEALAPYLKKGTQLSVVIKDPALSFYTKADSTQGVKLVGSITSLEFAGSSQASSNTTTAGAAQTNMTENPAPTPTPAPQNPAPKYEDFDDDIPF